MDRRGDLKWARLPSSTQISRSGKSLISFMVFKDGLPMGGKGHKFRLTAILMFFRMFSYDWSHKDWADS